MIEFLETLLYKLRFLAAGIFILACVLSLPLLLNSALVSPVAHAQGDNSDASKSDVAKEDSPNVITRGMFRAVDGLGQAANSTETAISHSLSSIGESTATTAAKSGKVVAGSIAGSAGLAGHAASSSFTFVVHSTGNVFAFIAHMPVVSDVIRPADKTAVPIINTSDVFAQSLANDSAHSNAGQGLPQAAADLVASWPIHGEITTNFGVPHWPYQPIHTGLDISDGQPSGVTPVHPFKPGIVKEVVHSSVGFGNHVLIDHGAGVISLYGHLATTTVQAGQPVDKNTVLGYEGSTGASTGTHLHFEIRLNGQPVDPRLYVSGQP